jgi:hypothetical protein
MLHLIKYAHGKKMKAKEIYGVMLPKVSKSKSVLLGHGLCQFCRFPAFTIETLPRSQSPNTCTHKDKSRYRLYCRFNFLEVTSKSANSIPEMFRDTQLEHCPCPCSMSRGKSFMGKYGTYFLLMNKYQPFVTQNCFLSSQFLTGMKRKLKRLMTMIS